MSSAATIKPESGMPDPGHRLWTPPSIDFTWHSAVGARTTLEDISRVEFTSHHVVFWRGDVLVLAEHVSSVHGLRQVQPEDPA